MDPVSRQNEGITSETTLLNYMRQHPRADGFDVTTLATKANISRKTVAEELYSLHRRGVVYLAVEPKFGKKFYFLLQEDAERRQKELGAYKERDTRPHSRR